MGLEPTPTHSDLFMLWQHLKKPFGQTGTWKMSMRSRQINLDCFSKHMNERVNIYLAKIELSFGRHWWTLNIKYQIISAAIIVPSQLLLDRKELLKSSYFYRYEILSRLSSFHKTNVTIWVTRKMKHTSVVKVQTFPCEIMPTLKSIYICISWPPNH